MTPLLAVLAGSVGGLVRYLLGTWRPIGGKRSTFVVNVLGAFLLGWVAGGLDGGPAVVAGGFLGGFTTFSTWMVDSLQTTEPQGFAWRTLFMLVAGLTAAYLGLALPGITGGTG